MSFLIELNAIITGTALRADADDGHPRVWEGIAIEHTWIEVYNPVTKAHDKVYVYLTPESKTAIVEALEEEMVEHLEDKR